MSETTMTLLTQYQKTPTIALRNRIALLNAKLVHKIALRYSKAQGNVTYEELQQIGVMGLLRSVERFDIGQRCAFSSYAYPFIRGEIQHYLRDFGNPIKIPRDLVRIWSNGKSLGLTDAETAVTLGVPLAAWLDAKLAHAPLLSLNRPVVDEAGADEILDSLAAPDQGDADLVAELYESIAKLSKAERDAVIACKVHGVTRRRHGANEKVLPITAGRRVASGVTKLRVLLGATADC